MPRSNAARVPQLLSPCPGAWEPPLLKPTHPRTRDLQQRGHRNAEPARHNPRGAPARHKQRKAGAATTTQHSQK